MKVAIVNYGMGNLGSLLNAFGRLGVQAYIADQPAALADATKIVLPGVGAFAEGMARLVSAGWVHAIKRSVSVDRKHLLGICLGMQMLASYGVEGEGTSGLGLIAGQIRRLDAFGCGLRIPHVGWNDVKYARGSFLFSHIPQQSDFYFVHSYALDAFDEADVIARTVYGIQVVAGVRRNNVFGTQFHPEKSSHAGQQLLRNFLDCTSC